MFKKRNGTSDVEFTDYNIELIIIKTKDTRVIFK